MRIVGITGTAGAGKGTIVDYLVRFRSFRHYSVRAYLLELIRSRGLPESRDSMVAVANELRGLHGPAWIVEELYDRARCEGGDSVIESIRTPGEAHALRERAGRAGGRFLLLAVDAPIEVRYERIVARSTSTDRVSFERFRADDEREMSSTDPNHQNIRACMELADHLLQNDGTREKLQEKVERILDGHREA